MTNTGFTLFTPSLFFLILETIVSLLKRGFALRTDSTEAYSVGYLMTGLLAQDFGDLFSGDLAQFLSNEKKNMFGGQKLHLKKKGDNRICSFPDQSLKSVTTRREEMLRSEIVMKKGPHAIAGPERKRQVLVVDDNKAIRDVLSRLLSFLGFDVTRADNGLEGGTLFLTGAYDLVVTDVHMPLMNGWELSRLIKERSPKTPVIVVTGFGEDKQWEKVDKSCVDAIIPKPFKLEEFGNAVQRLLDS